MRRTWLQGLQMNAKAAPTPSPCSSLPTDTLRSVGSTRCKPHFRPQATDDKKPEVPFLLDFRPASRVCLEPTTYGLKVRPQHIRRIPLRSPKLWRVRVLGVDWLELLTVATAMAPSLRLVIWGRGIPKAPHCTSPNSLLVSLRYGHDRAANLSVSEGACRLSSPAQLGSQAGVTAFCRAVLRYSSTMS